MIIDNISRYATSAYIVIFTTYDTTVVSEGIANAIHDALGGNRIIFGEESSGTARRSYVFVGQHNNPSQVAFEAINDNYNVADNTAAVTATVCNGKLLSFYKNSDPVPYPAGVWDSATEYEITGNTTPMVFRPDGDSGNYYILTASASTNQTPEDNPSVWKHLENYDAVYARILFADFAKLGSAIFSGDFMMSQNGTDSEGDASSDYVSFLEGDPYQEHNRGFTPNFLINFLTGAFHGCGGKARFNADGSGFLGGGSISWDASGNPSLKIGKDTEYIVIGLSNNLPYFELHSGTLNQGDAITPILTIGKTGTYNLIRMVSEWGEITLGNGTLKIGNSIYMSTDEGIVVNESAFSIKRNGTSYPVTIDSNGFLKI